MRLKISSRSITNERLDEPLYCGSLLCAHTWCSGASSPGGLEMARCSDPRGSLRAGLSSQPQGGVERDKVLVSSCASANKNDSQQEQQEQQPIKNQIT